MNEGRRAAEVASSSAGTSERNRPAITGRKTWSMNEDLRIVEPGLPFGPVYRVTGDWERLVESRQAFEWGKAGALGLLGALVFGSIGGSSDLVQALHVLLFCLLVMSALAALDAIWVARHAAELELIDRTSSGLDEWRASRAAQRQPEFLVLGLLLFGGVGAWVLWAALRPESSLNPWIFAPMALLLIGVPIRGGLARWRYRRRAGT